MHDNASVQSPAALRTASIEAATRAIGVTRLTGYPPGPLALTDEKMAEFVVDAVLGVAAPQLQAAERERIIEQAYKMATITYHGDRAVPLGLLIGWLRYGPGGAEDQSAATGEGAA